MIHNTYGFKPGDIVVLDAAFVNSNRVKIVYVSPGGMFCTIHPEDAIKTEPWDVMTNRLTPIENGL